MFEARRQRQRRQHRQVAAIRSEVAALRILRAGDQMTAVYKQRTLEDLRIPALPTGTREEAHA